jgi:LacI family transcriptional regulator
MKDNDKKITLAVIAAACKVTSMTVSLALRGDPKVSKETRSLVIETANKLGYRPQNSGRGRPRRPLDQQRLTVDLVWGISLAPVNLFYSQLLISIEQELARRGCDCVMRTCTEDYELFLHLCEILRASTAVATMIMGCFPFKQLQTLVDIVPRPMLVDHTGDSRIAKPYEYVAFDNVEAARLAIRHLVDLGHRKILLITGHKDHYFTRDVEVGYREIFRDWEIPLDPELIHYTDFSAVEAYAVVRRAIESGTAFDAIFTTEEMATGALRALYDKQKRIPDDVSVVGCEGLNSGRHTIPALTTVGLDYKQLGRVAVERVLAEDGTTNVPCRMRLIPSLVVRESTAKRAQPQFQALERV